MTNESAGNCSNCAEALVWVRHENGGAGLRHERTGRLMCGAGSYQSAERAPARCGSSEAHGAHAFYVAGSAGRTGRICAGNIDVLVGIPA